MTIRTIQRRRAIFCTNQPFAGGPGAKVYAGLGSADLIRYRPNVIFQPRVMPVNPVFSNDVSLATVTSPTNTINFTAPAAWSGRSDIWIQVRTWGNGWENESIYQPLNVGIDGGGALVQFIAGTYTRQATTYGDAPSAILNFLWNNQANCVQATAFKAVYVSCPTNFGTVTAAAVSGRAQNLVIPGALAAGTYHYTLTAVNGSVTLLIDTFSFTILAAPTVTGSATYVED